MVVGFHVQGLNSVVRDLKRLGLEVDDLKDAFATIAREAAGLIAAKTPRLTGRLAGDVRGNRATSKAVVTAGRASLPYAGPINYGWAARNIAPTGFMQAADGAYTSRAVERLEDEINEQITKKGLR